MSPQAAELFAEYFGSVYTNNSLDMPELLSSGPHNLWNLTIVISDIYTELKYINPDKGFGNPCVGIFDKIY